jgi:hypothetical protein
MPKKELPRQDFITHAIQMIFEPYVNGLFGFPENERAFSKISRVRPNQEGFLLTK